MLTEKPLCADSVKIITPRSKDFRHCRLIENAWTPVHHYDFAGFEKMLNTKQGQAYYATVYYE